MILLTHSHSLVAIHNGTGDGLESGFFTTALGMTMDKQAIDKLIESNFESLTRVLQQAAKFAIDNPNEIALNSMRSVARQAGVQPPTMFRLAQQLGFENYESFREHYRIWLADHNSPLAGRANALRSGPHGDANAELLAQLYDTESINLADTLGPERYEQITAALHHLQSARKIYVMGLRSLFSAAFYFNYVCGMFLENVTLVSSTGGTFADDLRRISDKDVLLAFSYHPYTQDALRAIEFSALKGAKVIAITDSIVAPAAAHATTILLAPNTSPSLLPSVIPALAMAQTLAALLLANSNEDSLKEIGISENQLRHFNVYLSK
jgi:DNA-binding MurR/RpiR family transcriptional regulator